MNRKKFFKLKRLKQQLGEIDCIKDKGYPKMECCDICQTNTFHRYLHEKPNIDCEVCEPAKPCNLIVCCECGAVLMGSD